ncbi:hypothetical protein ACFVTY_03660 [Streptomyces sp. NPDC058067]|uniref:hypothetical protein n=1 Tax=Streptomyces sp. NPDC058067 TaxID=3346324 RepID=UPI0036E91828
MAIPENGGTLMAQLLHGTSASDVAVDASTIDLAGESTLVEFDRGGRSTGWPKRTRTAKVSVLCAGRRSGTSPSPPNRGTAHRRWTADTWQDVAEISAAWQSPFMDFGTTDSGEDPAKRMEMPGPGDYRRRVHGRHRDAGDPRDAAAPVEEYLIQVWPAPHDEPALHKATSRTGELWRSARSAQVKRGLGLVRRSTATSCRSTSSSMSLDTEERQRSASRPSSRVKTR